jgi:hypothetical protein
MKSPLLSAVAPFGLCRYILAAIIPGHIQRAGTRGTLMLLAVLLALAATQVAAPMHDAEACPTGLTALPAGMESWSRPSATKAGTNAASATKLTIGTAVAANLMPTPKVTYAMRPEKPGGSVSSGGVFQFTVDAPGRYRVALGSGAWVDVLSGTTPAISVAHGHGPACSTIRKMVDFDLQPGRYLLQIAGNGTPTLPLMVARVS